MKNRYLDKTQGYLLDNFLRENIELLNGKKTEKIARLCGKELGFEISPSTINTTRKAMIAAGLEVWEVAPRGGNQKTKMAAKVAGLEKLIAEQDKKFAVVFGKLRAIQVAVFPDDPPSYACSEREILRDMSDETVVTQGEFKEMGGTWQS
tara:strand:+ start:439 stop:888 length:450 start_codon:yes stop_codon:yes gene_type:complete